MLKSGDRDVSKPIYDGLDLSLEASGLINIPAWNKQTLTVVVNYIIIIISSSSMTLLLSAISQMEDYCPDTK